MNSAARVETRRFAPTGVGRPEFHRSRPGRSPRLWHPLAGVFLVLFVGLLLAGRSRLFQDPGTFWHTALGERLLNGGGFTTCDSFTFTHQGESWLALQWLGEAALAVAHRTGGWDTVLLATALAIAVMYTWLAGRLMRCGLHWLPAACIVAVVVAASAHHFHARPHLASIAFLGLTAAWLCDVDARRMRVSGLWRLVPLFILWTNIHGGVLAGYATVVLAAVGWSVFRLLKLPSPIRNRTDAWILAGLVLFLPASFVVNPFGWETPCAWLGILSMPLPEIIQEHRPLNLLRPEGQATAIVFVLYSLTLWSVWKRRSTGIPARTGKQRLGALKHKVKTKGTFFVRVTWLLPIVWFVLAWSRVRHAPLFAIVAGVAAAELLPKSPLATWLRRWELFSRRPKNRPARIVKTIALRLRCAVAPIGLVAAALALHSAGVSSPVVGRGWAKLDPDAWPVEQLEKLQSIEREQPGASVFNSLHFGGFLEFHTPRLRTYIDDRCELFGYEFLRKYTEMEQKPALMKAEADRLGADFALLHAGSPADHHFDKAADWTLLQRGAAAGLYERIRK